MNKKIKFHYVYNNDYSPEIISGILSSISSDGSLELNFYKERNALPKSELFELDEEGKLVEGSLCEIKPEKHNDYINVVRHIKNGVILDKDAAENLKDLLEEYIGLLDKE